MPRRALVGISIISFLLAACGGQQQSPSADASSAASPGSPVPEGACEPVSTETPETGTGGTVRIGIGGSAGSLNPGLGELAEDFQLYELVYDTPINITTEGEYVPELATEWTVADDDLTWSVTLRDDATFHDGTPLTAEDVKFSLEMYRDNEFIYQSSYPDLFEEITVEDPTHLTIVTSEPVGNFEYRMVFMYIVPKHIWENEDPTGFANDEMIGSGPFMLTEFIQDESAELAAFEDYWDGRPIVDRVIFQRIENPDARVAALTNGEIDLLGEFQATAIPGLLTEENVQVCVTDVAAGGSLKDIIFNIVADENCPVDDPETTDVVEDGVCSGHPALKDLAVRQALATATDKQELITVATGGLATPGLGLVPSGLGDFYASELEDYAFDPVAAAQMLEDAGYVDEDGDGVRECLADQDCDDLTFRLNYPTDSDTAPREADVLAGQWAEVGVTLEIQGLEPETLTSVCCPGFDYDVILWSWGSDPDPSFLLGVLLCSEIRYGFSESGYCNPEYDELYAQQAVETDAEARIALVHEMQRIALEDVPYIIQYYEATVVAWRTDTFSGWSFDDPSFGQVDPETLKGLAPIAGSE